jgi:hypothetical protein
MWLMLAATQYPNGLPRYTTTVDIVGAALTGIVCFLFLAAIGHLFRRKKDRQRENLAPQTR